MSNTKVEKHAPNFETNHAQLKHYLSEILRCYEPAASKLHKKNTKDFKTTIVTLTRKYLLHLDECLQINSKLIENSSAFNCSNFTYNGYHSLSQMLNKSSIETLNHVKSLYIHRHNTTISLINHFFKKAFVKRYKAWCLLIQKLCVLFEIAIEMQEKTIQSTSLLLHSKDMSQKFEKNLISSASGDFEAFFGQTCAFYFPKSLKFPLTACMIALASSSHALEPVKSNTDNTMKFKPLKFILNYPKYASNPELRAQKVCKILKTASVEFFKSFWNLPEKSYVQKGSNLITEKVHINFEYAIEPHVLRIQKTNSFESIDVQPAIGHSLNKPLNIRIISSHLRQGMENLLGKRLTCKKASKKSPYLILHAHGGGFIALSPKTHLSYLCLWAKYLGVPIVSIDYSLAPEHPFPKASEECFYAYVWCLVNKDLLGWTGEKIICVGDSAGGVLVTNVVQRAIISQIRIPDAVIPIYAPFLLSWSITPSRLLSLIDPLLNFGTLWRCQAAYFGVDYKSIETKGLDMLNEILRLSSNDYDITKDKTNDSIESAICSNDEITSVNTNSINDNTKTGNSKEAHLKELYNIMGYPVFLIELLRYNKLTLNQFMSPLLTDDNILKQFPNIHIVGATNDPLMDDSIEFRKRFEKFNKSDCKLHIIDDLHHGFLNFAHFNNECKNATLYVANLIKHEFEPENSDKLNRESFFNGDTVKIKNIKVHVETDSTSFT